VLIIDKAQRAITTDAGTAVLFALKAARDELNSRLSYDRKHWKFTILLRA
jgi:hypothetical protein